MPLKNSLFRNVLLALFVSIYALGLFAYSKGSAALTTHHVLQALANGLLIGQVYFWMQSTAYKRLQVAIGLLTAIFYLVAHRAVLPYVWFWVLLLLQVLLTAQYERGLKWRQIPFLKNILIPVIWFVQLNLIPGLTGNWSMLYLPFFIFYLALSIQVDIEDIEADRGKIKTLAGLLGRESAAYVVLFLLTLFSFLMGLPWIWIMLLLLVVRRELRLPKGSYDALLLVLGAYFLLR
ncbi:MAG: hypothetical protein NWQ03_00200 [Crocinitomicaceae bacterium]|nr:hypothetical protein [Crocinitomicaceae bacterium]